MATKKNVKDLKMDAIQLSKFKACSKAIDVCVRGWNITLEETARYIIGDEGNVIELNYDENVGRDREDRLVFIENPFMRDTDEPEYADYLFIEDGKVMVQSSESGYEIEFSCLSLENRIEILNRAIEVLTLTKA